MARFGLHGRNELQPLRPPGSICHFTRIDETLTLPRRTKNFKPPIDLMTVSTYDR